jgi:hypothetical protein
VTSKFDPSDGPAENATPQLVTETDTASGKNLTGEQPAETTSSTLRAVKPDILRILQNSTLSEAWWEARQTTARSLAALAEIGKTATTVHRQLTETASAVSIAATVSPIQPMLARITMPVGAMIQLDGRAILNAAAAAAVGDQAGRLTNLIKAHKLLSMPGATEIASVKLVSGSQWIMFTADGFSQLHRAVTDATRRALRPILPPSTGFDELLRSMLLMVADRARSDFLASGDLESAASFAFDWLGYSPDRTARDTTLNAVVEVLLDEQWSSTFDLPDAQDHDGLRKHLRYQTNVARAHWKPISAGMISGRSIGSLNLTQVLPGGEQVELINLLPEGVGVEDQILQETNDRGLPLRGPLSHLLPKEQQVAWLFAEGRSWPEAAVAAGLPEQTGRNVRRKVQAFTRQMINREKARMRTLGRVVAE